MASMIRKYWPLLLALGLLRPEIAQAEPRELRVGRATEHLSMDPHFSRTGNNFDMMLQVYDQMVASGADMNMAPALATGWKVTDGLTWDITLRDDVRFHDGSPLTAADVAFSLQRVKQGVPGTAAGMADLIPIPAKTLHAIVDAFDDKELKSCWTDDMTLGWVYQYWNDPEREALDDKINAGGKIEPHEIASKTQMFTERYMVDWLLQNSLGPMWLAMCRKQGWTPEVEADGTLDRLEQRRIEWRAKRDAGEVSLTELMPLHTDAERRWAYYVPQPIPQDAIDHAPDSVWDLKILDPAVGSGHFLVVAFDLLFALYEEESRHRARSGISPIDPMLPIDPIAGVEDMGLMGSMGLMGLMPDLAR